MFGPSAENILLQRASEALGRGAGDAAAVADRAQAIYGVVSQAAGQIEHYTYFGVLPLAITLLVLHENTAALAEGRALRLWQLAVRIGATFAGLLAYGKMCALIVSVAGGGGGWMREDQFLAVANSSITMMNAHLEEATRTGVRQMAGALAQFMLLLFVWGISMAAALFAWVCNILLAKSQAILLVIFVAVGKTCISVSMVPGVGLWKSWARGLAQVAAWSTVAGVITMGGATGDYESIPQHLAGKNFVGLFMAAGYWVVLGVFTLSVPKITGAIFSGASPGAVGVLAAMGGLMTGIKAGVASGASIVQGASGAASSAWQEGKRAFKEAGGAAKGSAAAGSPDGTPGDSDGGLRPHKVEPPAPKGLEGRVLGGVMGAVLRPLVAGLGRDAGRVAAVARSAGSSSGGRAGRPLLRKSGVERIDHASGPAADRLSPQPVSSTAEDRPGASQPSDRGRRAWEERRPPAVDGPEVQALAHRDRLTPHQAAAEVVGQWAQDGFASARNAGDLEMTSARVKDHLSQAAGHFGGEAAQQFTQSAGAAAQTAHRGAAQRLGVEVANDGAPAQSFVDRHRSVDVAPAHGGAAAGPRPAVASDRPRVASAPAEPATERSYPLDAVTPLALRPGDQKPHQVSPHVIRRPRTQESPPPLRGGDEEEAHG